MLPMRIRGGVGRRIYRRLSISALLVLGTAGDAGAQDTPPSAPESRPPNSWANPPFRAILAVAAASRLLADGNGTTVRLLPAPVIGLGVRRHAAVDVRGAIDIGGELRLALASVRISNGAERSAQAAWQADFMVVAERPVHPLIAPRLAVGASLLWGPDDVLPFRGRTVLISPTVEGGATLRWRRASPLSALLLAQGIWMEAPSIGEIRGDGGVVGRFVVGFAYGR